MTEPLGPPEALGALKCDWSIGIQLYSWLCRLGWTYAGVWCISLLNPTDLCSCLQVCTTWNYQVSSAPKSLSIARSTRRMLKTLHHVSKKEMEFIVFPTQKQPLAISSPNTLTQIQTQKMCSAAVPFKCIKSVWHKSGCSGRVSPSKRPRQSDDICYTKKSKKRLRMQAVN